LNYSQYQAQRVLLSVAKDPVYSLFGASAPLGVRQE
jgi:hypothetical protein